MGELALDYLARERKQCLFAVKTVIVLSVP
jgi:hypothetical protein